MSSDQGLMEQRHKMCTTQVPRDPKKFSGWSTWPFRSLKSVFDRKYLEWGLWAYTFFNPFYWRLCYSHHFPPVQSSSTQSKFGPTGILGWEAQKYFSSPPDFIRISEDLAGARVPFSYFALKSREVTWPAALFQPKEGKKGSSERQQLELQHTDVKLTAAPSNAFPLQARPSISALVHFQLLF